MARSIRIQIDPNSCQACHRCQAAKACVIKAIVQLDPGEAPYLDVNRCRDCRVCQPACPYGAVRDINENGADRHG